MLGFGAVEIDGCTGLSPLNPTYALKAGKIAHYQLGQQYLQNAPEEEQEFIGVDRTFVDFSKNKFRPDVVNHTTGEVVEFKPNTYSTGYLNAQANTQAQSYVDRLNQLYGDSRTMEGLPSYWYNIQYFNKAD